MEVTIGMAELLREFGHFYHTQILGADAIAIALPKDEGGAFIKLIYHPLYGYHQRFNAETMTLPDCDLVIVYPRSKE